jgi:hypothetical protein
MPESLDFSILFRQLQSRYPASSLVTELVQVHAETFVVRALVQVGSTTLATGMAAAPTIELAEDQARLRVLNLLGISATAILPASPGFQSAPGFSSALNSTLSDSFSPTLAANGTHRPLPDLPTPASSVPRSPELPIAPVPVFSNEFEFSVPDALNKEVLEPVEPWPEPESSLPTPIPTKRDPRPRKSTPRKDTEANLAPAPAEPEDRSELIAQISVEIERIGWSRRRGSEYLQQTYGKKTRSELDDGELMSFFNYLKMQPSSNEVPFSD